MTQEVKNYRLQWFKAAGVRAVRTFCQTAVATIGTALVLSDVNWIVVGSCSLLAAILSMHTSLSGLPEVEVPESMKKAEAGPDDDSL